jgi:hypothetical protein
MKADEMRIIANSARMKQIDASKNKVSAEYVLIEERAQYAAESGRTYCAYAFEHDLNQNERLDLWDRLNEDGFVVTFYDSSMMLMW